MDGRVEAEEEDGAVVEAAAAGRAAVVEAVTEAAAEAVNRPSSRSST